jgi:DNA-binding IclR family transcriptional regulator
MIRSLLRGLEILEFVAEHGEASVTEVARFLTVDPSTSSRLMATLESRGYLAQDARSQSFRLGPKLLYLSQVLLNDLNLASFSPEILRALARDTGESAHLAVLVGVDAVFVDRATGSSVITVNTEVGAHDPTYCTAIGRALLSGLSDAEVTERLVEVRFTRYTPRTITTVDQLLAALVVVRRQGYAFDDEEAHAGVQCVAAPVLNHRAQVIAAVGISGLTARIQQATEPSLAARVQQASQELSRRLGFSDTNHARPDDGSRSDGTRRGKARART